MHPIETSRDQSPPFANALSELGDGGSWGLGDVTRRVTRRDTPFSWRLENRREGKGRCSLHRSASARCWTTEVKVDAPTPLQCFSGTHIVSSLLDSILAQRLSSAVVVDSPRREREGRGRVLHAAAHDALAEAMSNKRSLSAHSLVDEGSSVCTRGCVKHVHHTVAQPRALTKVRERERERHT